jgi:putative transposase
MPRPPRLVVPGVPLHVIQRGSNRMATFNSLDELECFRALLYAASRRFECPIHAYVFMTNHVHLLITPEDDQGPSRMMQVIGSQYAQYVNERYQRTGPLWDGRFRSCVVNSEQYVFGCSRYIELNPVRAGMASEPGHYSWSSYRHNAQGLHDPLITPHALYCALGVQPADRQAAYRALFGEPEMPEALEAIRHAANTGDVLGDDTFRRGIEGSLQRPLTRPPHGGDRRSDVFQAIKPKGRVSAASAVRGL